MAGVERKSQHYMAGDVEWMDVRELKELFSPEKIDLTIGCELHLCCIFSAILFHMDALVKLIVIQFYITL